MPGITLTGYAPASLAPEASCATSAVAARARCNPARLPTHAARFSWPLFWKLRRPVGGLNYRINLSPLFGKGIDFIP